MSIDADLLDHYQTGATTAAWGILLVRADGTEYGWTSSDRDAVGHASWPAALVDVVFRSAPGLDVQAFATSASLAVDNTELTVLADESVITRADIIAGRWDNAAYTLFRYNWADLSDGVEVRSVGSLGELQPRAGSYVAELRGLQQYLQQPVGSVSTKTCRYRLGSTSKPAGLCMVDTSDVAWTKTGTLSNVTSKQVVRDSTRAEAADFFGEGIFTFDDGLNAGLSQKVKIHAADGTFTFSLPMIFMPEVGDAYTVVAGCRKRLEEDCRDKFDNVINFGGEPHRPVIDELTSAPDVNV